MGGAQVETVINQTGLCGVVKLVLQSLERNRFGHAVGHIEHRGHTSHCGSKALGVHIGLMCKTGITEMNVVINHSGQEPLSCGIDNGIGRGGIGGRKDTGYGVVFNKDRCALHLPFVHHHSVFYQRPAHYACGAWGF